MSSQHPINPEAIDKAVAVFEEAGLSTPEALLASARLFTCALQRLKTEAPALRQQLGEDATRAFATEELNEVIYDIQDSIPVAVRIFNSLMREAEPGASDGPPEA